jgi:hypothetical protein
LDSGVPKPLGEQVKEGKALVAAKAKFQQQHQALHKAGTLAVRPFDPAKQLLLGEDEMALKVTGMKTVSAKQPLTSEANLAADGGEEEALNKTMEVFAQRWQAR